MKKILFVGASLFALNANALEYNPYVGVNYNYTNPSDSFADDQNSVSVNVGTTYTENFGTEVYYQYTPAKEDGEQFFSYGLDLIGNLPLGCEATWEVLASAGVGAYEFWGKTDDDGYAFRYGAGLQYNVDEDWSVRAMYRYIDTRHLATDYINEVSVGAKYNF
ncbi:MAG: porin family protein [Alphaproteobacteria bacterium]